MYWLGRNHLKCKAVTDCCPLLLSVTWESSCGTRDLISMSTCERSRHECVCNRVRNKDCVTTKQKHNFGVCTPQVCSRCSIWVSNQRVPTFLQNSVWPLNLSGISHCVLACCYKCLDGTWACLHTHSLSHIATRQRHLTQDSGKALYWGSIFHRKSCKPHLAGCEHQLYVTDEPFMSIHFQALFV